MSTDMQVDTRDIDLEHEKRNDITQYLTMNMNDDDGKMKSFRHDYELKKALGAT